MKLNTSIAGINLDGFAYNACGVNDEILKQLEKLSDSESAAILLKSCSIEPRKGNENPKYIVKSDLIPGCTLNSMGLSNRGLNENLDYVLSLKQTSEKPVFASLTCFSTEEHLTLFKAFQDQGQADLIELNFSCPNVGAHGLIGYHPELVDQILTELDKTEGGIKYGIKLPPYFEEWYFDQISQIVLKHNVGFITCINTLGNALVIDAEKESTVIKPNFGRGGLGGDWIKPVALSNVNSFFRRLEGKISIVGVGGIRTGRDAFEFLLAGADAVQVGSAFAQESYPVFSKIHNELSNILDSKGYESVQNAKGKLKFI